MKKALAYLSLAAGLAGAAAVASATVVKATIISGNPYTDGGTFKVKVHVTSNDTPTSTVVANSFKVSYNSNSVSLTSVTTQNSIPADPGDLGDGLMGPVLGTAPNVHRIVGTTGTGTFPYLLTPDIYTLTFTVGNPKAQALYSILIEDDPSASRPLLANNFSSGIPHTFDLTDVTNLGAAPEVVDWSLQE